MQAIFEQQAAIRAWNQADSQATTSSAPTQEASPAPDLSQLPQEPPLSQPPSKGTEVPLRLVSPLADTQFITDRAASEQQCIDLTGSQATEESLNGEATYREIANPSSHKRTHDEFVEGYHVATENYDSQQTDRSCSSALSTRHSRLRHDAYLQMLTNATNDEWQPIGLISTTTEHTMLEQEL